jgi:hypothetical protein
LTHFGASSSQLAQHFASGMPIGSPGVAHEAFDSVVAFGVTGAVIGLIGVAEVLPTFAGITK